MLVGKSVEQNQEASGTTGRPNAQDAASGPGTSNVVVVSLPVKRETGGSKSSGSYSAVEATYSRGRCLILVEGLQKSSCVFLHVHAIYLPHPRGGETLPDDDSNQKFHPLPQ